MTNQTIGFIGGGRVTRIFLSGWRHANALPARIVVSDPNAETLAKLQAELPSIEISPGDNRKAAAQSVVFLAVHPPVMMAMVGELGGAVAANAVVVSLAPKFTIGKLAMALGGHAGLARMIPNAPSIIGVGYNPLTFAPGLPAAAREELKALFAPLGDCPEVAEPKLEGYALLTGMGPTYLWFQLEILRELGRSFGLTDDDLQPALKRMVCGAARTLVDSGLTSTQVMDLIPVKPLAEDEAAIKQAYLNRLPALFDKIKP
jgi:pyrroline-5-carboxylate reductase